MKFDILNRFSGAVQVSVEIDCPIDALPSVTLGFAIKAAVKERAYLRGAYLRGADLQDAYLQDANLQNANLQ